MLRASPVLIISGERDHRDKLADRVYQCGLRPICCETIADAQALMARQQFSVVLCEDSFPDGAFRALMEQMGRNARKAPVVFVSRRDTWDSYVAAVGAGAFGYVAFPPNLGELEQALWTALSESKRSMRAPAQTAACQ